MSRVTLFNHTGYSHALSSYLSLDELKPGAAGREGLFHSHYGFVRVYAHHFRTPSTSLTFIHLGRVYHRRWPTLWGKRTIARLAREFVNDVVEGRAA